MQIAPTPAPTTLLWFTNDLRLHDNAALAYAASVSDDNKHRLLCLYCIDEQWFKQDRFGLCSMGTHRWAFLLESLQALEIALQTLGQQLVIARGKPTALISDILSRYAITTVVGSEPVGYNEQTCWQEVKQKHPHQTFIKHHTFTLFSESQLPFPVDELPASFSKFRRLLESEKSTENYAEKVRARLIESPKKLPSILHITLLKEHQFSLSSEREYASRKKHNPVNTKKFYGGENSALSHLENYFSSDAALHYKETRNALECEKDQWQFSSKFSPWLANGCISARHIITTLRSYEQNNTANKSTYWIAFELLWREYFQWYARQHGRRLFARTGIQTSARPTSFYPQRFQQWCHGSTPWPLVNACMKQLNQTGFLSNRGRQIVASCLVYELGLDWRCGAAYFEQQLIDYDVAANWGNWQYIAGVGADPRGGRQFNIAKQQQLYDPQKEYIKRWQGDVGSATSIDNVDAADWPM